MLVVSMLLYAFCLDSCRSQEEHCSLETPRLISSFEYLGKELIFFCSLSVYLRQAKVFLHLMLRENGNKTLFGLVLYYKRKGYVQNLSGWVTRQKSLSELYKQCSFIKVHMPFSRWLCPWVKQQTKLALWCETIDNHNWNPLNSLGHCASKSFHQSRFISRILFSFTLCKLQSDASWFCLKIFKAQFSN